jgi:predicted nucleic acid-binding protein
MILTDTSVVIAYERSRSPRLRQIIQNHAAAICGITVAELFVGVRTAADGARCVATLAEFQRLAIPDDLWETVGRNQALLQSRGVTVQLADTTIATLSIANAIELWTYDGHFALIQTVLPALKLFQEPP